VEESQPKEVKEHTRLVDPRSELARKLQRLNQRCLHPKKLNFAEPKQVVKEYHIHTKERSNGKGHATKEGL
jgi:hypothetical protein